MEETKKRGEVQPCTRLSVHLAFLGLTENFDGVVCAQLAALLRLNAAAVNALVCTRR